MLDYQPANCLEKSLTSRKPTHPWLAVSGDLECPTGVQAQLHACSRESRQGTTHTVADYCDCLRSIGSGGLLNCLKDAGLGAAKGSIEDQISDVFEPTYSL
jgi:hypothetical protein